MTFPSRGPTRRWRSSTSCGSPRKGCATRSSSSRRSWAPTASRSSTGPSRCRTTWAIYKTRSSPAMCLLGFLGSGTWGPPRADKKGARVLFPVNAPGVASYLAVKQSEIERLMHTFGPLWEQVRGSEFSRPLAEAGRGSLTFPPSAAGDWSAAGGWPTAIGCAADRPARSPAGPPRPTRRCGPTNRSSPPRGAGPASFRTAFSRARSPQSSSCASPSTHICRRSSLGGDGRMEACLTTFWWLRSRLSTRRTMRLRNFTRFRSSRSSAAYSGCSVVGRPLRWKRAMSAIMRHLGLVKAQAGPRC